MQTNIKSPWTFDKWSSWERKATHVWAKTFNITYYPAFQNFKAIKKELYILLTPNKKHKKVSPILPILGFRNSKRVKDFLVSTELPKLNESGWCEPCGKKSCLVCDSISTAMTFIKEACHETFKIQSGPLTCDSEKAIYLLKYKICGEVSYIGKAKTKFCYMFNNYKSKHRMFRKSNRRVPQILFQKLMCRRP